MDTLADNIPQQRQQQGARSYAPDNEQGPYHGCPYFFIAVDNSDVEHVATKSKRMLLPKQPAESE